MITLAVGDLDRSLAFYRDGLGLETTGVVATEFVDEETNAVGAIVIFRLRGGLALALYPRSELAKDADIAFGPPKTGEFSIGHLVENRAEVDALLAQAEQAGADSHRATPRSPLGDLLRLLPRPRRTPLGDHLEPADEGPSNATGLAQPLQQFVRRADDDPERPDCVTGPWWSLEMEFVLAPASEQKP